MEITTQFDNGFPERLKTEYARVISIIVEGTDSVTDKITDAYNSDKEIYLLSDGKQIKFPYRIYCQDDEHAYSLFGDNEKLIYDCIFTRSNDGYVREKHIENILGTEIPEWCLPYILRSSADYVLDIVNTIYEHLKHRDNSLFQAFCRNNPKILQTNYRRMSTYWNEYYRSDYPEFSTYIGQKLFLECFSTDICL